MMGVLMVAPKAATLVESTVWRKAGYWAYSKAAQSAPKTGALLAAMKAGRLVAN